MHFDDKDALLFSSLEALAETISGEFERFSKQDFLTGAPYPASVVFDYVRREPALFRIILNGQGGRLVLHRLRFYAVQTAHQALETFGVTPAVPPAVVADFMAGALMSVLAGWLEDDMRTPQDEMAQMFYQLVRPSILNALSLK